MHLTTSQDVKLWPDDMAWCGIVYEREASIRTCYATSILYTWMPLFTYTEYLYDIEILSWRIGNTFPFVSVRKLTLRLSEKKVLGIPRCWTCSCFVVACWPLVFLVFVTGFVHMVQICQTCLLFWLFCWSSNFRWWPSTCFFFLCSPCFSKNSGYFLVCRNSEIVRKKDLTQ